MYKYQQVEDENPLFMFTTASNLTYAVSFRLEDFNNSYFKRLYALDFSEVTQQKQAYDIKVQETIIQIILDFLKAVPNALLYYICDSMDGRHQSRSRLFEKWFAQYTQQNFSKLKINYPTEYMDYSLEFIYYTNTYNIKELQAKVTQQMDEFSEEKN